MSDTTLEDNKRELLQRILPPTNTIQPSTSSPRGMNDVSSNKSLISTKGDSPTPRNLSKEVMNKTASATQHFTQEYSFTDLDYNIIKDLKKT